MAPHRSTLDLTLIGNCSFAALIDRQARISWCCMPAFDGDPVFCSLLDNDGEKGFWDFHMVDFERAEQAYVENTAIVKTLLYDRHGNCLQVEDFAPRYPHYERFYKPATIVRSIKPVTGSPRISVRLRPTFDYGETAPVITRGGNHIRFVSPDLTLRLTTDAPISYITEEREFLIDRRFSFILGPDEPLLGGVEASWRKLKYATRDYWRHFVRGLALPFEWQDAVIRAAITLKLCTFEETGAVLAAITTSIPEAPNTERHWDYRYCWLRDSLFTINALNRLSITETMEDYIDYIMNTSFVKNGEKLKPFYSISLREGAEEVSMPALAGYRGMGPVRSGNLAIEQQQNDVWGAVVLALTQAFFDRRLARPGTVEDFKRLEVFGERAYEHYDKPDSGIWEFRNFLRVHTFSAVMCWACVDRLAKIADHAGLADRASHWRARADEMHEKIMHHAWNDEMQSFVEPFDGTHMDASLLLLPELGFIAAGDPKFIKTVERIEQNLMQDGLLYRYIIDDDFGKPEVAFTVCTFWYINALAAIGRVDEAREKFEWLLSKRNHVGLLSEDLDFKTGELWGNFPQTYSMVGLILSAMRLSKKWEEAI